MHITADRSNNDMLDQHQEIGTQLGQEDVVLNQKEQTLLLLFRQLSYANQDRVIRCADVLSKISEE